jgi:hypothetical protein
VIAGPLYIAYFVFSLSFLLAFGLCHSLVSNSQRPPKREYKESVDAIFIHHNCRTTHHSFSNQIESRTKAFLRGYRVRESLELLKLEDELDTIAIATPRLIGKGDLRF